MVDFTKKLSEIISRFSTLQCTVVLHKNLTLLLTFVDAISCHTIEQRFKNIKRSTKNKNLYTNVTCVDSFATIVQGSFDINVEDSVRILTFKDEKEIEISKDSVSKQMLNSDDST